MRIISLINQAEVIKNIVQHLGLRNEFHAPSQGERLRKEMKEHTFDSSDCMSRPFRRLKLT